MGGRRRRGGELSTQDFIDRVARALAGHDARHAERDAPFREAAVAVVLLTQTDGADLLMLKRATHAGDPWSGQVALPGGRIEPGDVTLLDTAIRETREETALDLAGVPLLGALDEVRPRNPGLPPMIVRPYVFALETAPSLAPSVEVAELFWAPVASLFDPARARRTSVEARGLAMTVDAIDFDGRIIWGMTERILRSLQSVVSGVRY
jgi:8-oxo-dGTP pyrophosphatase MutT (NUDIX family)